MTINHLMLKVNSATFSAMREFYNTALKPLGYVELMEAGDSFAAFGSDHPFLFVKAVEEQPSPIHFAFNAPGSSTRFFIVGTCAGADSVRIDEKSVDEFWKIAT